MSWKLVFGIAALLIFFTPIFPIPGASPNPTNRSPEKPLDVVRAYLKATHAHDFRTAYQYISSFDRNETKTDIFDRKQISAVLLLC